MENDTLSESEPLSDQASARCDPVWEKRLDLFLASFLLLFLELACIRWIPANVRLLSFFSNFVLLSCFLGMGVGFFLSNRAFKFILLTPVFLAVLALLFYLIPVEVQLDPHTFSHSIYYGAETPEGRYLKLDFLLVLAVSIILIGLTFIGPGQLVGSLFSGFRPLEAYLINIGGSIAGTLFFALFAYYSQPPLSWFALSLVLLLLLIRKYRAIPVTGALLFSVLVLFFIYRGSAFTIWSPYNMIKLTLINNEYWRITVNNIGHQTASPMRHTNRLGYPIPYLMKIKSAHPSLQKVLIIGSGMGNDVSNALFNGAGHVDAVDIDPVILDLGIHFHPEKPYQDPQVTHYCMDGRKFLNSTLEKYDVIIYALIDSLTLFSSFSSVRLENNLYSREAFAEARTHLKDDGVLIVYNYFRKGWLIRRVVATIRDAFGRDPIVLSYPMCEPVKSEDNVSENLMLVIAGDTDSIKERLQHSEQGVFYFFPLDPGKNYAVDGFTYVPAKDDMSFLTVGQPTLPDESLSSARIRITTDDWPFLYMRNPGIPGHYFKGIALLLLISMVFIYMGKGTGGRFFSPHYFFLGAGFMLLETFGIVRFSVLYGSMWFSNVVVFTTVLMMILVANIYMIKRDIARINGVYIMLLASVALNFFVNPSHFIGSPALIKYSIPPLVLFLPLFFAGIIFASSFKEEHRPQAALASNILGSMVGGVLEYFSLYLGFTGLLYFILACYVMSLVTRHWKRE